MKTSILEKNILQGAKKILRNQSFYQGKLVFKRDLPTRIEKVKSQEKELLEIIEFLKKKYRLNLDFTQGLFYFISEIAINIPEHARARKAFLKIIEIKKENKKFLEILIRDNGIGIRKSLLENKFFVKNDLDALRNVLRGVSAKNEKVRGFGLRTSKSIVTKAFGGNFLLFSGQEIFWRQGNKEIFIFSSSKIKGTAVDCLIPLRKKKINIYKFIE